MATILYVGTAGSDDPTRAESDLAGKNARVVTPKIFAERVAAADKVVSC